MDDKVNADTILKPEKDEEVKTSEKESKNTNTDDWVETKIASLSPQVKLERIKKISEQIDNHYVASVIYKDLERNLSEREKLISEFKNQLISTKEILESVLKEKADLSKKASILLDKQKECLKEYQTGAQELEEEVLEIDNQIKSLEEQISELKRRKSEIAEQQEVRLKDQDTTQLELQSQIEVLEKQEEVLEKQYQDLEQQIKTMSPPAEFATLDGRMEDLIHHICSIFETSTTSTVSTSSTALTSSVNVAESQAELTNPPIFQLNPWAAEENQGLTRLSVPVGVKQLVLSLHMPGDKVFERYSAELYSSNGRRVWNSDKLEVNGHAIVITFNSTFFLSDDYEMRLRGRNSERSYTPIAEYYFHVNKK